jgi:FAD/FMN-containing dehydrogenase
VYLRGTHVPFPKVGRRPLSGPRLRIPFEAPRYLLNRATLAGFNALQYRRGLAKRALSTLAYDPFFFPLDAVGDWNRLYGRAGFLQYQCVVPEAARGGAVRAILERVGASRETPALAVLKRFGSIASPGLLSFPRPGLTLAIDFAFRGPSTLRLLDQLDQEVRQAGGAVYPAKDARMSRESFRAYFPAWRTFATLVDPRFSSSFWRRVHEP